MKQLMRRLARVGDATWERRGRHVPEGHVPVYVGEEMERFAVPAELLGRPELAELLWRSAQEYGYEQRGVLRIPCPVPLFRRVLGSLLAEGGGEASAVEEEIAVELLR